MQVVCAVCEDAFEAKRSSAKFCSSTCRQRAKRGTSMAEPVAGIVEATRAELVRMKKLDSMLGQQALTIAARLARPANDTGSAVASLSRELSRLMAAAGGTGAASDPVDEVRRRREQKAARATQG